LKKTKTVDELKSNQECFNNIVTFFANSVLGVEGVLQAAIDAGVAFKNFIRRSTRSPVSVFEDNS